MGSTEIPETSGEQNRMGFEFPGPFADMGEATFCARARGILMLRYIRRHAESVAKASGEQARKG